MVLIALRMTLNEGAAGELRRVVGSVQWNKQETVSVVRSVIGVSSKLNESSTV